MITLIEKMKKIKRPLIIIPIIGFSFLFYTIIGGLAFADNPTSLVEIKPSRTDFTANERPTFTGSFKINGNEHSAFFITKIFSRLFSAFAAEEELATKVIDSQGNTTDLTAECS